MHAFPESSDQFLHKIDWPVVRIHATVHNANQFWRSWNYLYRSFEIFFAQLSFLNFTVSEAASRTTGLDRVCQLDALIRATTISQLQGWLRDRLFCSRSRFSSFTSFSHMVPTAAGWGWFFLFLFYKLRKITKGQRL